MQNSGFIKIYRELINWSYFKNSTAVHLLIFLILEANYKETKKEFKGEVVTIKAGQLLTGRKYISAGTGISESSVERWLNKLEKCKEIEQQKSTKNRIITVLKWHRFQVCEQQTNNKRTTNGQQTDTPKKERRERKEEIETYTSQAALIFSYLNERLNTRYKSATSRNLNLVKARIKEGFTIEDFKSVINKKAIEWENDIKMKKYLRPETLFGTKFEAYLNQPEGDVWEQYLK